MKLTPEERKDKLHRLLDLLQTSRYVYAKEKGGTTVTELPPPVGSHMNCQSAARIFMQIAADMGVDELQALYYKATVMSKQNDPMGYLVPTTPMVKALGMPPEINHAGFTGWEFENHWRVRDLVTGIVYDPTFGTSSPNNPIGILATSQEAGKNFEMTSIYGERHAVARVPGRGIVYTELNKHPIKPNYKVTDAHFTVKPMDNLRAVVA